MMKKKIAVLTMAGSIVFGSVAGAASSYYVNEINAFKEQQKSSLASDYTELNEHYGGVNHRDLNQLVQESKKRIETETDQYLENRIAEEAGNRHDQEEKAIRQATDQAIKELKQYIDSLLKGETE